MSMTWPFFVPLKKAIYKKTGESTLSPSIPFNSDTTNATCATML